MAALPSQQTIPHNVGFFFFGCVIPPTDQYGLQRLAKVVEVVHILQAGFSQVELAHDALQVWDTLKVLVAQVLANELFFDKNLPNRRRTQVSSWKIQAASPKNSSLVSAPHNNIRQWWSHETKERDIIIIFIQIPARDFDAPRCRPQPAKAAESSAPASGHRSSSFCRR